MERLFGMKLDSVIKENHSGQINLDRFWKPVKDYKFPFLMPFNCYMIALL